MPSKYGPKVIAFYKSAKWQRIRLSVLSRNHGMCERCNKRAGTEVHHIIPVTEANVDDYAVSLNEDNLMLLCKECHDAIRRSEEQDGSPVKVAFSENGDVIVTEKVSHLTYPPGGQRQK